MPFFPIIIPGLPILGNGMCRRSCSYRFFQYGSYFFLITHAVFHHSQICRMNPINSIIHLKTNFFLGQIEKMVHPSIFELMKYLLLKYIDLADFFALFFTSKGLGITCMIHQKNGCPRLFFTKGLHSYTYSIF